MRADLESTAETMSSETEGRRADDAAGRDEAAGPWWWKEPVHITLAAMLAAEDYREQKVAEAKQVKNVHQASASGGRSGEAPEPIEHGFASTPMQSSIVGGGLEKPSLCLEPDRLDASVEPAFLYDNYIAQNRPFVIKRGWLDSWPAGRKWTRAGLLEHYADVKVTAVVRALDDDGEGVEMTIGDFVSKHMLPGDAGAGAGGVPGAEDEERYVSYAFGALESSSPLGHDVQTLAAFDRITADHEAHFRDGDGVHSWSLGSTLSGPYAQTDQAAWNALVYGRRHWILASPMLGRAFDNRAEDAVTWFTQMLPQWHGINPCTYFEFVQEEGEVVFVPDAWPSRFLNLGPSVAVSKQLGTFRYPDELPAGLGRGRA